MPSGIGPFFFLLLVVDFKLLLQIFFNFLNSLVVSYVYIMNSSPSHPLLVCLISPLSPVEIHVSFLPHVFLFMCGPLSVVGSLT